MTNSDEVSGVESMRESAGGVWTPFPDWEATKTGPGSLVFLSFGKVL